MNGHLLYTRSSQEKADHTGSAMNLLMALAAGRFVCNWNSKIARKPLPLYTLNSQYGCANDEPNETAGTMESDLARGLRIQARVVLALMLREARTRYGRAKGGYLW